MIFVTYGGPDSYWDGTVYVHDNYQEATYNAVVEDYESPETSVWEVVDELYYPPDGGDPEREYPCDSSYPCLQTRAAPRPNRHGVLYANTGRLQRTPLFTMHTQGGTNFRPASSSPFQGKERSF